ncbi:MAG: HU family DNA-binding protein [Clostridia bacterium]|jgi:nucleoid DNA-binding protein
MNKNELSLRLSQMNHLTKMQSDDVVSTIFDIIKTALKEEGKVCIKDFGTFQIKCRKGRIVKDISTQEEIVITDLFEMKLKVAQAMKEYLNDEKDIQ